VPGGFRVFSGGGGGQRRRGDAEDRTKSYIYPETFRQ